MESKNEILRVKNLEAYLCVKDGTIKILDQVNLKIDRGKTLGLVGETGTGKTVTALSILGILQPLGKGKPLWKIEGEVLFRGRNLLKVSEEDMRKIRGTEITFIPQNPIPSLHPMDIIGSQTGEAVEVYEKARRAEIHDMVVSYLGKVEISDAKKRYYTFRDQFSGGEGQRIMIAMALIRGPSLLIADEPTSSLDVTVQRQVLQLLKAVKERFHLSMLLITHDLGVIAEMSDHVAVLYAGKVIECGDVITMFKEPKHPYTQGLLAVTPRIDATRTSFEFGGIPGESPDPRHPIPGCKFHPRCKYAKPICSKNEPETIEIKPGHTVSCLRVHEI